MLTKSVYINHVTVKRGDYFNFTFFISVNYIKLVKMKLIKLNVPKVKKHFLSYDGPVSQNLKTLILIFYV